MHDRTFDRLLTFSLFFLAYWFFGNLYEEIVMIPNQLVNPHDALHAYQNYFKISNPIYYFVPFTQLAVVVICILYFCCGDAKQKQLLKKAAVFGVLSLLVTAIIVTQINVKIFSLDFEEHHESLFNLSLLWMVGNAFRMYLTGSALYFTLKTFVLRKSLLDAQ